MLGGGDADEEKDGDDEAEAAAEAEEQDEEDRTGVEIEITPAGKSTKRLTLLSGGEKSLTALAFLFAVFLARPCPFYILDEVEAALDDLNIDRFLTLLRQFSDRAQFIVVTHQKRTMEAADCLYGVSMAGNGVSKVVSRRLPPRPAARASPRPAAAEGGGAGGLNAAAIRRHRLRAQRLAGPPRRTRPRPSARSSASRPRTAPRRALALRARCADATDLAGLVRTWAMRGTLHLLAADGPAARARDLRAAAARARAAPAHPARPAAGRGRAQHRRDGGDPRRATAR